MLRKIIKFMEFRAKVHALAQEKMGENYTFLICYKRSKFWNKVSFSCSAFAVVLGVLKISGVIILDGWPYTIAMILTAVGLVESHRNLKVAKKILNKEKGRS